MCPCVSSWGFSGYPWFSVALLSCCLVWLGHCVSSWVLVCLLVSPWCLYCSPSVSVGLLVFLCACASLRLSRAASMGFPVCLSVSLGAGFSLCASLGLREAAWVSVARSGSASVSLALLVCLSPLVGDCRPPSFSLPVGAFPWVSVGVSRPLLASVWLRASASGSLGLRESSCVSL